MKNRLLEALGHAECARLAPHLDIVQLEHGEVLYESNEQLQYAFFPVDALVSLLYVTEDGHSSEISIIGNDGIIGIALFLGGDTTPGRALVQCAGTALRLPASKLKKELQRHARLHDLLLRYTQTLLTQMAQTAVCNRHHSVEQQFSRLLLLAIDRMPSNELTMTHEIISNMLGVRREGVTEVAGKLQKLGVIEYHRGLLGVLDRSQLEQFSCECYAVVKTETNRLLSHLST